MTCIHPLSTDIEKPERFTYPFCYEPHPLCLLAAEEVKRELATMQLTEGKMFGVLVVSQETDDRSLGFLAAYSGLLEGRNDWPYFVPPVFDAQQPDGHFKQTEREISLTPNSKKMSQDLQLWLFHQYQFLNARGEVKDLINVWQDYHCSPKIKNKYPLPPGGTGDCCAPKLLQYAYQHDLKPICMAEFWWGPSAKNDVRHHGQFYPACRGKCKPILTWMLQGLDVDPNPEEAGFPHLIPEIVYDDEAMAVLDKPSGLLSIPGRTEDFSVATWAKTKWPDSMLVHRLDMGTSGLIVVAKTKEAYLSLQEQFVKHTIYKRYVALVDGIVSPPKGRIELPLLCDPMNRPRQMVDYHRGKSAVTEYEVLSTAPTLLALYPHTGRTHQLRVHCAHPDGLGCPILGDELYGRKDSADRLCLHCDRLELTHPITNQRMHFECKPTFI
jgi:tRNA pseudouridine32 synthase/23S rRNA pseudouridine746 synthase